MTAKRGRPPSQKTVDKRLRRKRAEIERKRAEDMLNNPPIWAQRTPLSELTLRLAEDDGNSIEKALLADYSDRPFIPPELIFELNDLEVSPLAIAKYERYLNAPNKGAEAKAERTWGKTKRLLEHNQALMDDIKAGRLTVNDVAKKIHGQWFEPSAGRESGKLKKGIEGLKQKSVSQLRRDIKRYLQQKF
jgi:hypothetical protein